MTKYYSPVSCDDSSQSEWNRHIWYLQLHLWMTSKAKRKRKHFMEMIARLVCVHIFIYINTHPFRMNLGDNLVNQSLFASFYLTWSLPRQKDSMIGIPNWSLVNVRRCKLNTNCTNNIADALNSPLWMLMSSCACFAINRCYKYCDIYHSLSWYCISCLTHLPNMSPSYFKQQESKFMYTSTGCETCKRT